MMSINNYFEEIIACELNKNFEPILISSFIAYLLR
jgi:hypothetical protein